MPELQKRALEVAAAAFRISVEGGAAPSWLSRPGPPEDEPMWSTLSTVYEALTDGLALPPKMPPRERRSLDGVFRGSDDTMHVLEIDETQHFNRFRAQTLSHYPAETSVGFPIDEWTRASIAKHRLEGGGFAKPRPPLFGMKDGRHRQRAFRDAMADLLPPVHGWGRTVRLAYFELEPWIWGPGAPERFKDVFALRFDAVPRSTDETEEPTPRRPALTLPAQPPAEGRTQPVTPTDLGAGRIRIPADTKPIFPSVPGYVRLTLRGEPMTVRYDPKNGPDRSRSGVLSIGKANFHENVRPYEQLAVRKVGDVYGLE